MKKNLIIIGAGSIAELAHLYFSTDSDYDVKAFSVDHAFRQADHFCKLPLVDFETLETQFSPQNHSIFVAISYQKMNQVRATKFQQAQQKGYDIASYFSSKATILSDIYQSKNCFVLEDNTIQPFVKIADNVTLWSGNHIGYYSEIDANAFISSHVVLDGYNRIGENVFIGVNSTLAAKVDIADYSLIAAGTLLESSTEAYGVYYGFPAKKGAKSSLDVEL